MSVFCDGACPGNGTARAKAAWAWAFWDCPVAAVRGEPKMWGAEALVGTATNQRAELKALLEAVRFCAGRQGLTIYTDSMYAMNCASVWGPGWKRKGWKRDAGEIMNLDLIQPLVEEWAACKVPLKHVRGHQSVGPQAHGNNWVDRAAVAAVTGTVARIGSGVNAAIDRWTVAEAESGPDLEFITHMPIKACPGVPALPNDIRRWFS